MNTKKGEADKTILTVLIIVLIIWLFYVIFFQGKI